MIKRIITVFFYIVALLPAFGQEAEALNLSLKDAMLRARKNSVDAEVALNQLKSAYWSYRSYRAELLPEVSLNASVPS